MWLNVKQNTHLAQKGTTRDRLRLQVTSKVKNYFQTGLFLGWYFLHFTTIKGEITGELSDD